jgi:general stress protein 26
MKKITLLFFLSISLTINAQQIKNTTLSKSELIKAAKEIMNATGTCAFITQDKNSISKVRMMDPFPPEKELVVWFGTNSTSRKVSQLKLNNKVTLYYRDKDDSGYVTLHGKAELVNNQQLKKKYWKKTWEGFYPKNKENYLLIKFTPHTIEIVSPPRKIVSDSKTWEPPTIIF